MTRKANLWVGIDIGEESSLLSAINARNKVVCERMVATSVGGITDALLDFATWKIRHIAVEAGATSIHLARELRSAGYDVLMCETRQVSRYLRIRTNKTDTNDARGLAEIAKLGQSRFARVHVKSVEIQRIRSQLVLRHRINLLRIACEGTIRSFFKLNGGEMRTAIQTPTLKRNVKNALERLKIDQGVDLSEDILPLLSLSLDLRTYVKTMEDRLTAWAASNPVCSRFMEIPGIGVICAVSFYSAIEDPARFNRAIDVGSYLGLTPKVLQSGKSLKHARISKRGNKLTRSHLCMAASSIIMRCGPNRLKEWAQSLVERAGHGKARVALARKLAVVLLAIWKSGERYHSESTS